MPLMKLDQGTILAGSSWGPSLLKYTTFLHLYTHNNTLARHIMTRTQINISSITKGTQDQYTTLSAGARASLSYARYWEQDKV
jgi:hypothetical protein